jgi:acetyltransferase
MPGLDGLRGLAALAVVVLHVWMYTDANTSGRSVLVDAVIGEMRVAVGLFFVLSGFLLARPWIAAARGERARPDLGRFALKRFARIAPAYWLALAGAFVVFHGSGHGREGGPGVLPVFAVFMENMFASTRGKLDPPMWSLGIEVMFYAALPLIGWALVAAAVRSRRAVAGPLVVCAALVALNVAWMAAGTLGHWPPTTMWTLPTYLALFACGIAAAVVARDRRPGRVAGAALLGAGWLAVLVNGWWHSSGTGVPGHIVGDLPAAAGFAIVVGVVATRPPGLLASAPFRALGALSYGVYLWHYPVLYAWRLHGALPDHAGAAFVAVLVPTLAVSAASHLLVERPVLAYTERALRRGHDRRRTRGATARPAPVRA